MGAVEPQQRGPSAATAAGGNRSSWTPHGKELTACLVALNVFLVLLVYVYFWRVFARAPRRDEEDGSSSPKARDRREAERAVTALPVFVHSSVDAAAAECAICIAEFADGEEGRLLPRCGHRFHARCVDTWFQFHTTCPLCRAAVLPDAPEPALAVTPNRSSDTDSECPV